MTKHEIREVFINAIAKQYKLHNELIPEWLHIGDIDFELDEPKIGHWVHGEYCSECGCDVPAYIIDWKWQKDTNAKYCPNCGAKMESEVDK